jgi:CBS domain-containing protein
MSQENDILTPISDLNKEKIQHLDLQEFSTVEGGTLVREVIETLRRERRNCALILSGGKLVGIFTDRDVLRKVATKPETWDRPIDEFMTQAPTTLDPQDSARQALTTMDEGGFRNVPIVDAQGIIHGNVSHYAFIKFLADHYPQEVYNLPPDDSVTEDRYGG